MKVAAGGGSTCSRVTGGSGRTNLAAVAVGVKGDIGGRSGDRERERERARWGSSTCDVLSDGDVDRVVVGDGMVKAGILQPGQTSSLLQRSAT